MSNELSTNGYYFTQVPSKRKCSHYQRNILHLCGQMLLFFWFERGDGGETTPTTHIILWFCSGLSKRITTMQLSPSTQNNHCTATVTHKHILTTYAFLVQSTVNKNEKRPSLGTWIILHQSTFWSESTNNGSTFYDGQTKHLGLILGKSLTICSGVPPTPTLDKYPQNGVSEFYKTVFFFN